MAKRDIENDPSVRSLAEEIFVHLCDLCPDEQRQTMEELNELILDSYRLELMDLEKRREEVQNKLNVFVDNGNKNVGLTFDEIQKKLNNLSP